MLLTSPAPACVEFCDPNPRRCAFICERNTCHPQHARWIPSLAVVFSAASAVFAASAASVASGVSAASAVSASAASAASAVSAASAASAAFAASAASAVSAVSAVPAVSAVSAGLCQARPRPRVGDLNCPGGLMAS